MIEVPAHVGDKALRLYEDNCVRLDSETRALVKGDSDWYVVQATLSGLTCSCAAWSRGGVCSHAAAASIAWAEAIKERVVQHAGR